MNKMKGAIIGERVDGNPLYDEREHRLRTLFTFLCRAGRKPRIVVYKHTGERVWIAEDGQRILEDVLLGAR